MSDIILPHLFKIKTNVSSIHGFSFFDLNKINDSIFGIKGKYPEPAKTYSYELDGNIAIPNDYEMLYRWYKFKNQTIYYQRPITKNFSLKLKYDLHFNKLTVSPCYHHLIRFELGNIWPPGKILSNFIAYDLQKLRFGIFHGMSLKFKGNIVCVFTPGANFKTSLLKTLIQQGGEYISEDKLIIKDGHVYSNYSFSKSKIFVNHNQINMYEYKITHVFFVFRSDKNTCSDLKNTDTINSFLNIYNLFNFLGSGWALNLRKLIDLDIPVNNWYEFLNFNNIKNIKLIKIKNFEKLTDYFLENLS